MPFVTPPLSKPSVLLGAIEPADISMRGSHFFLISCLGADQCYRGTKNGKRVQVSTLFV